MSEERVIKFKGKSSEASGWCEPDVWVTGNFVEWYFDAAYKKGRPITPTIFFMKDGAQHRTAVYRESVGQFTGLHDRDGKEIYEGDVLQYEIYHDHGQSGSYSTHTAEVRFIKSDAAFYPFYKFSSYEFEYDRMKIIGNRFENPELL